MLENELFKKIIISIIIIIFYIAFYYVTKHFIKKAQSRTDKISVSFNFRLFRTLIAIVSVIIIMLQFDSTKQIYSSILTNISLLVVVIGFIAQESLKNIISGIMIAKSKPFNTGQRIVLEQYNITGTVVEITLQHTVIQKVNNTTVIVPNSIMGNTVVENSAYNGDNMIANFLDIQVAYESDVEKAIEIIKKIMMEHPFYVKEKTPVVLVRNLGTEGYDVRATVWTNSVSENFQACSDMRIQIKKRFDENNIEIPYNHMNLLQPNITTNEIRTEK